MPHHYNPSQPRVPKGRSNSGEWTRSGNGPASPSEFSAQRRFPITPARPSAPYFPNKSPVPGRPRYERVLDQVEQRLQRLRQSVIEQFTAVAKRYQDLQLESALDYFDRLSSANTKHGRAVLEFRARDFDKGSDPVWTAAHMDVISEEQVRLTCPRFKDVQEYADDGAAKARGEGLTGAAFGNRVHRYVEAKVEAQEDPNFRAELSFALDDQDDQPSNTDVGNGPRRIETPSTTPTDSKENAPDSIRADVIEKVKDQNTVCVYDIKTGGARLSTRKIRKIMARVAGHYPDARIVVVQVRPDPNGHE